MSSLHRSSDGENGGLSLAVMLCAWAGRRILLSVCDGVFGIFSSLSAILMALKATFCCACILVGSSKALLKALGVCLLARSIPWLRCPIEA